MAGEDSINVGKVSLSVLPDMTGFFDKLKEKLDTGMESAGNSAGKKLRDALDKSAVPAARDYSAAFKKTLDAEFQNYKPSVKINADTKEADAKVDELKRKIAGLDKTVKIKADPSTSSTFDKTLSGFQSKLKSLDSAFGLLPMAIVGLGPALLPVLASATVGTIALGGALSTAAAGAGAFGLVAKEALTQAATASKAASTAQSAYAANIVKANDAYGIAMGKATTSTQKHAAAIALASTKTKDYQTEVAALNKAYAGMSPSQIALSKQVGDLNSAWLSTQRSLNPIVSGALVPWIKAVTEGMRFLKPLITPVAAVFKSWGESLSKAFSPSSPGAKGLDDFFKKLGGTSATNIKNFGTAIANFAKGLFALGKDAGLSLTGASKGIEGLSQSFLNWSKSKKASDDIQKFMAWVKKESPAVKAAFEAIGKALGQVVQGAALMGGGSLKAIILIMDQIAKLSPSQIRDIGEAYIFLGLAIKGLMAVTAVVQGVSGLIKAMKALKDMAILTRIQLVAMAISEKIVEMATAAWTIIQAVIDGEFAIFDAELLATGLPLLIAGIALLVVGVIEAYKHSKTFRDIIADIGHIFVVAAKGVVSGIGIIKNVVGDIVDFVKNHWKLLILVIGPAGVAIDIIATHFNFLKKVVVAVVTFVIDFVKNHWKLLLVIIGGPIGLLIVLVIDNFTKIKNFISATINFILSYIRMEWSVFNTIFLKPLKTVITWVIDSWVDIYKKIKSPLTDTIDFVGGTFQGLYKSLISPFESVIGWFKTVWSTITSLIEKPIKDIGGVAGKALHSVGKFVFGSQSPFADGGPVIGPGNGTSDSISARLSNGEYVVKASQAAKHRPLLDSINTGAPGFAAGGPVVKAASASASSSITENFSVYGPDPKTTKDALDKNNGIWQKGLNDLRTIGLTSQKDMLADQTSFDKSAKDNWSSTMTSLENTSESTWKTMTEGVQSFFKGVHSAFVAGVADVKSNWKEIVPAVEQPVHQVITTVINSGLIGTWNKVASDLHLSGLNISPVPVPFAHGGVLPGYAPGVDSVAAMLSPGEGILVPEAVRAIGTDTVHKLNAHFGKGRNVPDKSGKGINPPYPEVSGRRGYADGGIASENAWINGVVNSQFKDINKAPAYDMDFVGKNADWLKQYVTDPTSAALGSISGKTTDFGMGGAKDATSAQGWISGGLSALAKLLAVGSGGGSGGAVVAQAEKELGNTGSFITGQGLRFDSGEWCADFVDAVFHKVGDSNLVVNSGLASAVAHSGTWHSGIAGAQPGDIFGASHSGPGGAIYHTGIVTAPSDGKTLKSIAGNTGAPGGAVSYETWGAGQIAGYGHPNFPPAAGGSGQIITAKEAAAIAAAQNAASTVGSANIPGNVHSWITQGMNIAGRSGNDWQSGLEIIAMHESGGNANAVNRTDSNAAAGHPSAGLMQFIQPTFSSYAKPGYTAWMNPIDQVVADAWSGGYIPRRYGTIDNVPGVRNVRAGGRYIGYDSANYLPPGYSVSYNGTGKPEKLHTNSQVQSLANGNGIYNNNSNGSGITIENITLPEKATVRDLSNELSFAVKKTRRGIGSVHE